MIFASPNARGAFFMVICMAGFSMNDALIKLMSQELGLFQMIFLRGLFASVLIGLLWWQSGERISRPSRTDLRMMGWRLLGEIGGTVCFLLAIFNMPLANATAILQAMPLAVTLAAALFLGEKVGWRRYVSIGVGFIGMLIIVRPGADSFNYFSLSAVAACGFLVLRDMSTRQLSPNLPSRFITFITAVSITTMGGLISLFFPWAPVTLASLSVLAVAAVFVVAGYLFGVMAMRIGDVGAVAPFRYSVLLFATVLGVLLFDEWPNNTTLLGGAILVATGVYSLRQAVRKH